MPTTTNSILALDVGNKRVGVAIATHTAHLPRPLATLERGEQFFGELGKLVMSETVDTIIVGWPRGLNGQHTAQTAAVENFANDLRAQFPAVKVDFQDEALTSRQAETELQQRGKTYHKADIDSLAAVYILEDWLAGQSAEKRVLP